MAVKSIATAFAWMVVGVGLFIGLIVIGVGSMVSNLGSLGAGEFKPLVTKSQHAVGVVEIEGEIVMSKDFAQSLERLVENKDIKSIVVRIDSPGGAVGASEEMYRAIKKARETKPVVCSMGTVAASGGVYAAMGCQKIVANRGTLTGSVGVIVMSPNVKDFIQQWGVSMTVIKSGKYKDSGSPFREVTEDDRALLQSVVNSAYKQFVDVIVAERNLPRADVEKFADGRVLSGDEALAVGLIDEHGDIYRAAKVALTLAGDESEPELVYPEKEEGIYSLLSRAESSKAVRFFESLTSSRLLYMTNWQ